MSLQVCCSLKDSAAPEQQLPSAADGMELRSLRPPHCLYLLYISQPLLFLASIASASKTFESWFFFSLSLMRLWYNSKDKLYICSDSSEVDERPGADQQPLWLRTLKDVFLYSSALWNHLAECDHKYYFCIHLLQFSSINHCWFHQSRATKPPFFSVCFGWKTPKAVDLPGDSGGSHASVVRSWEMKIIHLILAPCSLVRWRIPAPKACRKLPDWLFYLWAHHHHWCQSDW